MNIPKSSSVLVLNISKLCKLAVPCSILAFDFVKKYSCSASDTLLLGETHRGKNLHTLILSSRECSAVHTAHLVSHFCTWFPPKRERFFCAIGFDTSFFTAALRIGRNALKLSTNVHRQLGSHPSLYRIFAHRFRLGKMCGTTLRAAGMHNPPVTYNQSIGVPQQILYTALVFQALKFSFSSDIYSPLSWLDTALESRRGRQNDLVESTMQTF